MTRRRNIFRGMAATLAVGLLAVPVALAAPNGPDVGQRIDLKVLVVQTAANEAIGTAWRDQLDRLGVPYDAYTLGTSAPITDATLADYTNKRSKYEGIILATGDAGLAQSEKDAIRKVEATFGIRQISDNTSLTNHGGGTNVDGGTAVAAAGETVNLTASGKSAFPYLKGAIKLPASLFAYRGTVAAGNTSLVEDSSGRSLMSIWNRPDGTQELQSGMAGNNVQSHFQLLRDGMVNWLTRGVYLGQWRTYLGLDVDDIFLPDDKWDAATDTTNYDPANAIRMTSADVDAAVAWQNRTGLKLNMVYNMAGSTLDTANNGGGGSINGANVITGDPLLAKFQTVKNQFRWINHTYEHPNLDCTTAAYTANQVIRNQAIFNANLGTGLAAGLNDSTELITGEHSGLANLIPGNPGTIDPPNIDSLTAAAGATGLAAGVYDYGVSASTAGGDTPVSVAQVTTTATGNVQVAFDAVCKATGYKVYRRAGTAGTTATSTSTGWTQVGTVTQPATSFNDNGAVQLSVTDTGATGAGAALSASNSAIKVAYAQNPAFITALTTAGIKSIASDTSKPYPSNPSATTVSATDATNITAGSTWVDGPAQVLPRYPTNAYYNVANRADQLDEYNWVYRATANGGGCVASATNTCRTADATWAEYLASEATIMEQHLFNNDPRPHYFHQTNIAQASQTAADTDTTVGGTAYALVNTVLRDYEAGIDRTSAPIVQLTQTAAARLLANQAAWKAAKNNVTAYVQDDKIHITSPTTLSVPVTGSTQGEDYAGNRSGYIGVQAGVETVLDLKNPITIRPAVVQTPSTTTQAVTPVTPSTPTVVPTKLAAPSLSKLSMSSRKFGAARKGLSTKKSSTTISYTLSRAATVKLVVQTKVTIGKTKTKKGKTAYQTRGVITLAGKAGANRYVFNGKVAKKAKALTRGSYRVVATATASDGQNSKAKSLTFSVVKR